MEVLPQVPVKPLIPAIPTDDKEFRELKEDLRAMGCDGLHARPWNVQSGDMLRKFLFLRGNQWDETTLRDPQNWTPDTWCEVYGFKRGIKEGWTGRKDGLFAGKFKGEVDPKEGLHPGNYRNPRVRRMLEFMMPILNLEKPKRITLTVANTMFGALSGVRLVNWGLVIHEIVARGIHLIGRKPSYLSPFIMHLYQYHGCTTVDEDDMLLLAAEEVVYKLQPVAEDTSTEGDHPIPDAPPSPPGSPPESFRRAGSPPPPSPHHPPPSPRHPPPSQHDARPSRTQAEAPWQNVDLSAWTFPENPFQRAYADQALNDCGPGNILRELANKVDRKELDQAKKELGEGPGQDGECTPQRPGVRHGLGVEPQE